MKWRCGSCKWSGRGNALLLAPNPFNPAETVFGCPACQSVGDFVELCDEPGCIHPASCGFPVPGGAYRRTCHEHSDFRRFGELPRDAVA
jgi:hypothetical protein